MQIEIVWRFNKYLIIKKKLQFSGSYFIIQALQG